VAKTIATTDTNPLGLSDALNTNTAITDIELTEILPSDYSLIQATPDASLTGQNLATETNTSYDANFSKDVLNDFVDSFFGISYTDERREALTFARPGTVDASTVITEPIQEDTTIIGIKEQLSDQFGVDADTAELIIQAAKANLDESETTLTADAVYKEVGLLIKGTSTETPVTTKEYKPNIAEDFGNSAVLFSLLAKGTESDTNTFDESITTTENYALDGDTAQAFLESYIDPAVLKEKGIDLESLISDADIDGDGTLLPEEFESLLTNLNAELAGDDPNNNPLGLPQTGNLELL
jgi:hypothetical protein